MYGDLLEIDIKTSQKTVPFVDNVNKIIPKRHQGTLGLSLLKQFGLLVVTNQHLKKEKFGFILTKKRISIGCHQ